MASPKLALPFVVTFTTAAMACGGTAVVQGGGGGSGGAGSSSSANTGATSTASSNSSSATGNPNDCPAEAPGPFQQCTSSSVCNYDVACQSGTVNLQFTCDANGGRWQLTPTACDQPHDSCPGTEYHCIDSWQMPEATNPPAPCPDTPPEPGAECFPGGFGGVWEYCGYRCDDTPEAAWTLAHCPTDAMPVWQYDEACAP